MDKKFYHGTTDLLPIKTVLLPATKTGVLREEWRDKYKDKVFFTNSIVSAGYYAKKACAKYGGNPIVYAVKPIGQYFNTVNNEYVADKALIVGIESVSRSKIGHGE